MLLASRRMVTHNPLFSSKNAGIKIMYWLIQSDVNLIFMDSFVPYIIQFQMDLPLNKRTPGSNLTFTTFSLV